MRAFYFAFVAAVITGLGLFGSSARANTLIDTFTVTPAIINPGGSATLDLNIAIDLTGLYTSGYFTSGTVKLYSGIGSQHTTFTIANPSSSPLDFSATYTYPSLGTFTPKYFEFDVTWVEKYTYSKSECEVEDGKTEM